MEPDKVGIGAKATVERSWKISGAGPLTWRLWGGDCVIYHPLSGDTQILDVSTAEIVRAIERLQPDTSELCRILAAFLEVENGPEIEKAVAQVVGKLDDLGIIEPASR